MPDRHLKMSVRHIFISTASTFVTTEFTTMYVIMPMIPSPIAVTVVWRATGAIAVTSTVTADEYVAFCGTHYDHIVIPEPYKSKLLNGLREAVLETGNKIVFHVTFVLFLA